MGTKHMLFIDTVCSQRSETTSETTDDERTIHDSWQKVLRTAFITCDLALIPTVYEKQNSSPPSQPDNSASNSWRREQLALDNESGLVLLSDQYLKSCGSENLISIDTHTESTNYHITAMSCRMQSLSVEDSDGVNWADWSYPLPVVSGGIKVSLTNQFSEAHRISDIPRVKIEMDVSKAWKDFEQYFRSLEVDQHPIPLEDVLQPVSESHHYQAMLKQEIDRIDQVMVALGCAAIFLVTIVIWLIFDIIMSRKRKQAVKLEKTSANLLSLRDLLLHKAKLSEGSILGRDINIDHSESLQPNLSPITHCQSPEKLSPIHSSIKPEVVEEISAIQHADDGNSKPQCKTTAKTGTKNSMDKLMDKYATKSESTVRLSETAAKASGKKQKSGLELLQERFAKKYNRVDETNQGHSFVKDYWVK